MDCIDKTIVAVCIAKKPITNVIDFFIYHNNPSPPTTAYATDMINTHSV